MPQLRIQADVVIASSRELFAPGQVVVRGGQIIEVTSQLNATADVRLDGWAVLPGLVNPHTHLEFSDLDQPLPAGENFPQWISQVLTFRQGQNESSLTKPQAILRGLDEAARSGVAALADIVTMPWQPSDFTGRDLRDITDDQPLKAHDLNLSPAQQALIDRHLPYSQPSVIACLEQLGLSPDRRQQVGQWCEAVMTASREAWPTWLIELGFSPHAPYSTQRELCQQTVSLAAGRNALAVMHLAESPAERQWLDHGTGPMAEMLARFAVSTRPPEGLLHEIIDTLAGAPRALLVHGNYLTTDEMDRVARYRDRLSVVYCPRTHLHFDHAAYPLEQLQARGIRVVLGTDSRSTNPDLNLWSEAQVALRQHKCLRPSQALAAIMDQAAHALGLEHRFGSLRIGADARLNLMRLPASWSDDEDLISHLFQADHPLPMVLSCQ